MCRLKFCEGMPVASCRHLGRLHAPKRSGRSLAALLQCFDHHGVCVGREFIEAAPVPDGLWLAAGEPCYAGVAAEGVHDFRSGAEFDHEPNLFQRIWNYNSQKTFLAKYFGIGHIGPDGEDPNTT